VVDALGQGRYRITRADGTSCVAYAVAHGRRVWVHLDGRTYVVSDAEPARASAATEAAALSSPMPATVTAINVAIGTAVEPGDVLIVLEAMKMEMPITAFRSGRVTAIRCRAGELVQPGVPLVDVDAPPSGAQHG
jgi:biotin carboxyl carrier protein